MLKLRKEFACLLNNAHASNGTFEEVAKKVGLLDGFGSAAEGAAIIARFFEVKAKELA